MVSFVEPTPAVNLRGLPQDDRGYRVPAEAPWGDDGPLLSKLDPSRMLVLTAYRGCAVCGYRLRRDEPVWRIVDTYSRGTTFQDMQQGSSTFDDPPGHLVCMLYSALVCPFWRSPGGRLGQDSVYDPGGRRGETPSILGFGDYALLLNPSKPFAAGRATGNSLLLKDYEEEIVFHDPLTDLAQRYERERQRVGGRYVTGKQRHYAPQFGGAKRLIKDGTAARDELRERGPDEIVPYEGRPVWLCAAGWMHEGA